METLEKKRTNKIMTLFYQAFALMIPLNEFDSKGIDKVISLLKSFTKVLEDIRDNKYTYY